MTLQLDHEVFTRSTADVRADADRLENATARISQRVDGLLDCWRGRAAASYAEAWAEWQRGAAEVQAALDGVTAALADTHADLTATDRISADVATRLEARLR